MMDTSKLYLEKSCVSYQQDKASSWSCWVDLHEDCSTPQDMLQESGSRERSSGLLGTELAMPPLACSNTCKNVYTHIHIKGNVLAKEK